MKSLTALFLILIGFTTSLSAQDFFFVSDRNSSANQLNFEVYRYLNGAQIRVTNTAVSESGPLTLLTPNSILGTGPGLRGRELIQIDLTSGQPIPFAQLPPGIKNENHPFLTSNKQSVFVTSELTNGQSIIRELNLMGQELGIAVDHQAHVGCSVPFNAGQGANPYLVYVSDRDGDFDIFVKDLTTGNESQITQNNRFDGAPMPSSDGSRIAFSTADPRDPSRSHIFTMNRAGSDRLPITDRNTPGCKFPFAWDSDRLLYVSYENGVAEIFCVDLDTMIPECIVSGPSANLPFFPDHFFVDVPVFEVEISRPFTYPNLPTTVGLLDPTAQTHEPIQLFFAPPMAATNNGDNTVDAVTSTSGLRDLTLVHTPNGRPGLQIIETARVDVFQPMFPGTGEQVFEYLGVNGPPTLEPFQDVTAGDTLRIVIESENPMFFNDPLVVGVYNFGAVPGEFFPGLWIDPVSSIFILGGPPLLGQPIVPVLPGGNELCFLFPPTPGAAGSDLMTQAIVADPAASNGMFSTSDGIVIRIQ